MALYRRSSRSIFDSFRSYASKVTNVPRNINNQPINGTLFSQVSQPIFRNNHPVLQRAGPLNHHNHSPFIGGAKRFYNVDRMQIQQYFKANGYRWFKNPRNDFIIVLLGSGVVITLFFGRFETVPYSKRTHFLLLPRSLEKSLGEKEFKKIQDQYTGRILPPDHPDNIRVQRISQEIIQALHRGSTSNDHRTTKVLSDKSVDEEKWDANDEILDDQWVQKSRKKGQETSSQTTHLEGLKWEVIVVNDSTINAFCLPGGKIVMFTGLLNHFRADSEVATVIAHEVGHAVARHSAEKISKRLWFIILQSILYQFLDLHVVNTMSDVLLRLPFSRRMETEADYIGLLLVASAGYDPRAVPQVYEKLGKLAGGDSRLKEYLATHPSGKKRAELLTQAEVMKEAFELYREFLEGHGTEGFL